MTKKGMTKRQKPKYNKRAHKNRKKGNPGASRQRDQRVHITESHRTHTIEVHPAKTARILKHQEA